MLVAKLEENRFSVFTVDVFVIWIVFERAGVDAANGSVDDGICAYCKSDFRRIDFDDEPNNESSSLILANGLFFI